MPREYRNFNNVGKVSCLLVLLLTFLAVNPMMTEAYAENGSTDDYRVSSGSVERGDDDVAASDAIANSVVGISFSPGSGTGQLTPENTVLGAATAINVQATVNVKNSDGFRIYMHSDSSQLKNGNNTVDSVTTNTTLANMPDNRWGYAIIPKASAIDTVVPESTTYAAMPTARGVANDTVTTKGIKDSTYYYMLSFAARIGYDKPAGTYSNTVTMSVVSDPMEVGLMTLTNMQDMTNAVCAASDVGETKQLKDTRDGKYYWVAKLADGKCWMTQNLDLDLSTSKVLTSADSDVTADYTPWGDTEASATKYSIIENSPMGQQSWSLGDYRITNPAASNNCGYPNNSAADCTSQFTAYDTPITANNDASAHYILGNHYQWNAATAGTGGSIISGQAASSICPKGWRLPTSGSSGGEFRALRIAGGIPNNDVARLTDPPYYFVRGGCVTQYVGNLFDNAGDGGYYWSSTPFSSADKAYELYFYGTSYIIPSNDRLRETGGSVRCIAK